MSWAEIFERGATFDVTTNELREALVERREGGE